MMIIRIKKAEDLPVTIPQGPIQLEVYLRGTVLNLAQIDGNCLIRAEGCRLPRLEHISGNLSIDAADAAFPALRKIGGDCNIHEKNATLPLLEKVVGTLILDAKVELPALKVIGLGLKNKANVRLPSDLISGKQTYDINSASDVKKLPDHGYFHLNILADDIQINIRDIFGTLTIKGSRVSFPNLAEVNVLLVGNVYGKTPCDEILFPVLKLVRGTCKLDGRKMDFPQLEKIGKTLHITAADACFPALESLGGLECADVFDPAGFPALKSVEDGKIDLGKRAFPSLEYVHSVCLIPGNECYPSVRHIEKLVINSVGVQRFSALFPGIESLNEFFYHPEWEDAVALAEDTFFEIIRGIYTSKKAFIFQVFSDKRFLLRENNRFPLNVLVAILKMRHSSFDSFRTREYEREWVKQHTLLVACLDAIEAIWPHVPALSFEKLFKMTNRILRRFCFNYVGVSSMMKSLKARRIASSGIELNYFQYDAQGNKTPFSRHNVFEVYEAEASRIQELRSWRNHGGQVYAVKCWCTSTDHEHWLWIEEKYKDDPLEAIASTFRVHENVIPHIKCLKRQGDVLICEMKKEVIPEGAVRPLTKAEYFGLLEVET